MEKKNTFALFVISADDKTIEVEKESPEKDFTQFINQLPSDDCRFAVYDFAYEVAGQQRNKLVFISWIPDTSKIKKKMLYASSKLALCKRLDGIASEIQATDYDEISEKTITEKLTRGSR
ncbi:Cofilin [Zancudomyces culisetae]|uniref:Cofilin n=1 Tax=Zancudomyces culisetae TaxID=1213189 RepID=A0A1R1PGV8_ZANCU|nr:Cofilin [Zancudomyces culisetae]OMH84598.1 Cofilin [Zancudomyces culisetae]|eukprot:OMH80210.1 Cofilin [Zancudomyces culisetae]